MGHSIDWRGTGCPIAMRGTIVDVGATLTTLATILRLASPAQARAICAWCVFQRGDTDRIHLRRIKRKAVARCLILPPWWMTRVALRQAVVYGVTVDPVLRPLLEATRAWLRTHYPDTPIPGGS